MTNLSTLQSQSSESLSALLLKAESEKKRRKSRTRLCGHEPYPKQGEFHAAGRDHRERLLMAANQVGKTSAGAAEIAMHATGRYPDWWEGRRFEHPISALAGPDYTAEKRTIYRKKLNAKEQNQRRAA